METVQAVPELLESFVLQTSRFLGHQDSLSICALRLLGASEKGIGRYRKVLSLRSVKFSEDSA